jgi:DhnA family fructose-bisphosphate aldolase class Ia
MIGNIVSLLGDRADYLLEAYQSNHFDVLAAVSRKYAHKIPFLVKMNHNELLTYPNQHKEILFGTVKDAYDMGAAAVGATTILVRRMPRGRSSKFRNHSR